jgi:hypothetical protein
LSKSLSKKQAVKLADKYFSLYIRARDPKCVTCGAPTSDCSHVFRRGHHATRWDENNAYGVCRRCHFIHHNQTESYLHDKVIKILGRTRYDEMRTRWETISDFKTYQIEEIANYYRRKI